MGDPGIDNLSSKWLLFVVALSLVVLVLFYTLHHSQASKETPIDHDTLEDVDRYRIDKYQLGHEKEHAENENDSIPAPHDEILEPEEGKKDDDNLEIKSKPIKSSSRGRRNNVPEFSELRRSSVRLQNVGTVESPDGRRESLRLRTRGLTPSRRNND